MPEIPEMENYRTMLERTVLNKPVAQVRVERPRSINVTVEEFTAAVTGQLIREVARRAKHLIFHLSSGFFLITHMMLDGRLYFGPTEASENLPGKPHIMLDFADGSTLYFCGLGLGFLHLLTPEGLAALTSELGVEPLTPEFTYDNFVGLLEKRRGAIKPLLMDQKIIAGIGNAYSNEILFVSGVLPQRPAPSLDHEELRHLWQAVPRVLGDGIRNGGYLEEPYAAWDQVSGGQNLHFMVYDRSGEPCKVCGSIIREEKISGRWAYFCTLCQR